MMDVDDILEHLPDYAMDGAPEKSGSEASSESENSTPSFQTDAAETVFSILTNEPKTIDQIADETDISSSNVTRILTELEINDVIEQVPGKRFRRK